MSKIKAKTLLNEVKTVRKDEAKVKANQDKIRLLEMTLKELEKKQGLLNKKIQIQHEIRALALLALAMALLYVFFVAGQLPFLLFLVFVALMYVGSSSGVRRSAQAGVKAKNSGLVKEIAELEDEVTFQTRQLEIAVGIKAAKTLPKKKPLFQLK